LGGKSLKKKKKKLVRARFWPLKVFRYLDFTS
jgi:hypothetical protein